MTRLHALNDLGQAIWLDFIRRSFVESGDLKQLVDDGVRGVTSNPTIFEKAIAGSADYDDDLNALIEAGKSVQEIYEALAIADIQHAADVLRPVYDAANGADGFVSLEVSPTLAHDTEATIAEARRLHAAVNRPNLMIKVPATPAGIPAIQTLIGEGINVNVTLIFSVGHYEAVVEAYLAGLEARVAAGGDVSRVASVASFFVSRVDTKIDAALEAAGNSDLQGTIAVANAKVAYARFQELFSGPRWDALAEAGAHVQRPLWASTGTKNPAYSDTLYVDTLIGPHTVNTLPPATLDAFKDHGTVARTVDTNVDAARAALAQLSALGIDLDAATQALQDEGVEKFATSFESLMASIADKRERLMAEQPGAGFCLLDDYTPAVDAARDRLAQDNIIARIWERDHTVWKPEPTEITNRLGWLDIADRMGDADLGVIAEVAADVRAAGYTHALLLGMGGSSLAPEVFRKTFGVAAGYLDLAVLDSTDPGAVLSHAERLDPATTLFIVSTKSGGTVETLSFFKYFYNRTVDAVGVAAAGEHFVAITDAGSKLDELAQERHFRAIFRNDPNIGGRYSALSYFGVVPAGLMGMDLPTLLERAWTAAQQSHRADSLAARLGATLGTLAGAGRDKLTLITSPALASFGDWVEQLIAESTGKAGKGILPVVGEPVGTPDVYGADRLFVYLKLADDDTHDAAVDALLAAGHPVVRLPLQDRYDLGAQFFVWELATAVASHFLAINPFNQPDVEAAKVRAREMVAAYSESGVLPAPEPALRADGIAVYGDVDATTPAEALRAFVAQAGPGAYIALQAYVEPTAAAAAALNDLRTALRAAHGHAVTVGFGPRFLHSTGQLHKGDGGNGLFIQITAPAAQDAPIPDEPGEADSSMTFDVLKHAQALGDRQALLDAGRRVIRFELSADVPGGVHALTAALASAALP